MKYEGALHYRLVPYILLCTGCRLNEAVQLRTTDLKQTEAGVWTIDWKHEPTAELPMLLKTKAKNNRCCPMHPLWWRQGFQNCKPKQQLVSSLRHQSLLRLVSGSRRSWWAWGCGRKRKLFCTPFGSARDLWREVGMPQDYRNAMTGHASKEVGESLYGQGLSQMPDVVIKELMKVKLSWLP